jgi:hypothetical protein
MVLSCVIHTFNLVGLLGPWSKDDKNEKPIENERVNVKAKRIRTSEGQSKDLLKDVDQPARPPGDDAKLHDNN